jgi:hypothetical protein
MGTATINPTDSERVGEWLSGEVIDFLDDLHTDVGCRVEAFAGRVMHKLTETALLAARESLTTMLGDLGVRTVAAAPEAPQQNVLPLTARTRRPAATSAVPPAAAPAPPADGRTARAPRSGGIADEITTYLKAHPGEAFTASAMAKATGDGTRSSGAFDAAAKRMADRGELVVASETPRKYTLPGEAR